MEKAPIKNREIINLQIGNIGKAGDGIAFHKNFVIIVPKGEIGKWYKIEITKVFDNYGFGIIKEEINDGN